MFKKVIPIILSILMLMPNVVLASSKMDDILKRCSFYEPAALNDQELNAQTRKGNECIKQEIIKLVELNISHPESRTQILKSLDMAMISSRDVLWFMANDNYNCGGYLGCGTAAQYLVADSQVYQILKIFLSLLIDIDDRREEIIQHELQNFPQLNAPTIKPS